MGSGEYEVREPNLENMKLERCGRQGTWGAAGYRDHQGSGKDVGEGRGKDPRSLVGAFGNCLTWQLVLGGWGFCLAMQSAQALMGVVSPPLAATEVVTVFVFQEPSLLSSLQDNGLTDVMLHALLIKDVGTPCHQPSEPAAPPPHAPHLAVHSLLKDPSWH